MGIRSNELRIGNWFIDHEAEPETTIYWQVESIERVSKNSNQKHLGVRFRNGSCWSNASIIEPIPLTEEWLVKFGLEDNNSYFCSSEFKDFRLSWSIRVVKTNERRHFYLDDNFPEIFQIKIDYVHQLQNLYFALCGTELEIKDNDKL